MISVRGFRRTVGLGSQFRVSPVPRSEYDPLSRVSVKTDHTHFTSVKALFLPSLHRSCIDTEGLAAGPQSASEARASSMSLRIIRHSPGPCRLPRPPTNFRTFLSTSRAVVSARALSLRRTSRSIWRSRRCSCVRFPLFVPLPMPVLTVHRLFARRLKTGSNVAPFARGGSQAPFGHPICVPGRL